MVMEMPFLFAATASSYIYVLIVVFRLEGRQQHSHKITHALCVQSYKLWGERRMEKLMLHCERKVLNLAIDKKNRTRKVSHQRLAPKKKIVRGNWFLDVFFEEFICGS
jgi:hypothetical protein